MDYFVDPRCFSNGFIMPSSIADEHLKLASAEQLKVIIYLLRHISDNFEVSDIAAALKLPESEIADALAFWASTGILLKNGNAKPVPDNTEPPKKSGKKAILSNAVKPTREEVAKRGLEDNTVAFLLREAQVKFGRLLKSGEAATLLWLYDDQGMDLSLILMLIEYACRENKCNIGFIERTAVEWINNEIADIASAENYIESSFKKRTAWRAVEKAFGMADRKPSAKEADLAEKWICEWNCTEEVLKAAYDCCVNSTSNFSIPYISRILNTWYEGGKKGLPGENTAKRKSESISTYDISKVEEMINMGYKED